MSILEARGMESAQDNTRFYYMDIFKRSCYLLLVFEVLLGIAHLLWPEYRWGQGRSSYFNFNNSLTMASWLASIQLFASAILALIGFHRDKRLEKLTFSTGCFWLLTVFAGLMLSFIEITKLPSRFQLWGFVHPDIYVQGVITSLSIITLIVCGGLLLNKLKSTVLTDMPCLAWLSCWSMVLILTFITNVTSLFPQSWMPFVSLISGLGYLFGCTLLMLSLGSYVLRPVDNSLTNTNDDDNMKDGAFFNGATRVWTYICVGGMTFSIVFLQILLFRLLTIFGDYLTATSVISIALLGITVGGLIAYCTAHRTPLMTVLCASISLPFAILLAFATTVKLMGSPFIASLLLMLPFICAGTVICIALAHAKSYFVYFIDLIGAAIGALVIGSSLTYFREESSFLFLAALTLVFAMCFAFHVRSPRKRMGYLMLTLTGVIGFGALAWMNLDSDWLNVVREKIKLQRPSASVLFSRSSFMGRYDVIRRTPHHKSLATFDNGRIIDNIRKRPVELYKIDPRIPHTLMKDPVILILGLSGDGVSKTSRSLGKKVYGVEINPAIVKLQQNELLKFNENSYKDIDVSVMDARSYIEQSNKKYDMITLMNAHQARGRMAGRAPSPEYLNTLEAVTSYLHHLTDRGVLIVEEPVSVPRREPPVWKFVNTMRQALINIGHKHPAKHFFIFQWKTKRNNYIQILMKKTPFTPDDIVNLRQWLDDVDNIKKIEAQMGRIMGPINSKTTILYSPDESYSTNYSRLVRGEASNAFKNARNLRVTTDDRPFHFDVNPKHPEIKKAYSRTLLLALLLLPFILFFFRRNYNKLHDTIPFTFIVALTGLGYLLIEVVLIERYEILLGSPVITFSTVLGTLLLFSGLGSLWSGSINKRGVYLSLSAILLLLLGHVSMLTHVLAFASALSIFWKVVLSVLLLAPLGFFMGVPFPYILRSGKKQLKDSAAAFLFAVNAAASALAVPLAINISTSYGLNTTFMAGIMSYLMVGCLFYFMDKKKMQVPARSVALIGLSFLLLWPWQNHTIAFEKMNTGKLYKVFAVSYGRSYSKASHVFKGASNYQRVPFEWLFWVIKGNNKIILVDTGFNDSKLAKRRGIYNYVSPIDRLNQLHISPSEVSDIILTHSHWDHIGSLAAFQHANVWMQKGEYKYMLETVNSGERSSKGIRLSDVKNLNALNYEGRLKLVDGNKSLFPGIEIRYAGGHTPGSQYVIVNALDGLIVLASDNTYMYQNNRKHIPIGKAADHDENMKLIHEMQTIAASPFYIIPGHDPRVMYWFPRISNGIVQISSLAE